MQSQLVCSGCRTILQYPSGAADVRCALCDTVSPVLPMGLEMDLMICGCCRTLLMYSRGVSGVRCLCCGTLNLMNATPGGVSNQYPTVSCGNCQMILMYPHGASLVKCVICGYITNVGTTNGSLSSSTNRQNGVSPTASLPLSQSQTVVIENPMSLDRSGKLLLISAG
ncbi:unnamed protein product [Amaranthus hypochondriacus]